MQRRKFVQTSVAAVGTASTTTLLASIVRAAEPGRKPKILVRNGWQSINIGGIAHWVGLFELLEKHGIEADTRLCY